MFEHFKQVTQETTNICIGKTTVKHGTISTMCKYFKVYDICEDMEDYYNRCEDELKKCMISERDY